MADVKAQPCWLVCLLDPCARELGTDVQVVEVCMSEALAHKRAIALDEVIRLEDRDTRKIGACRRQIAIRSCVSLAEGTDNAPSI